MKWRRFSASIEGWRVTRKRKMVRKESNTTNRRKFVESSLRGQSSLPRNVDRTMFGHGAAADTSAFTSGSHVAHLELSEQVISGFGQDRSADILAWMDELKADSSHFIESRLDELVLAESRERRYREAVTAIIDKIFQDLRYFSFEFNKVARGTSMQMIATILGDVTEVLQVNSKREVEASATYFRARISNRHFGLVVRGAGRVVEFYLVPTPQLMGQSVVEAQYEPIAVLEVKMKGGEFFWKLVDWEKRVKTPDTLEELAMQLFAALVEVTKDEVRRIEQECGSAN